LDNVSQNAYVLSKFWTVFEKGVDHRCHHQETGFHKSNVFLLHHKLQAIMRISILNWTPIHEICQRCLFNGNCLNGEDDFHRPHHRF
jgi:hypothetical protein